MATAVTAAFWALLVVVLLTGLILIRSPLLPLSPTIKLLLFLSVLFLHLVAGPYSSWAGQLAREIFFKLLKTRELEQTAAVRTRELEQKVRTTAAFWISLVLVLLAGSILIGGPWLPSSMAISMLFGLIVALYFILLSLRWSLSSTDAEPD